MEKTNVMRILGQHKISYNPYFYDSNIVDGITVALTINKSKERVFKTLVTTSKSNINYVFLVPVYATLDLKKAAASVKEKSIEMLPQKELFPLTGYIHGGCSPIGMKKNFKTIIDESCQNEDTFIFSAGKRGCNIEVNVEDIIKLLNAKTYNLI